MKTQTNISRRNLLKSSALSAGGAALYVFFGNAGLKIGSSLLAAENLVLQSSPYIKITSDNMVEIFCHRSDMGQGARTSVVMLIAEELAMDWRNIKATQADGDKKYGDQNTDGSHSVRDFYDILLDAGATARTLLVSAAAKKWGVSEDQCIAKNGNVYKKSSDEQLAYGQLVEIAAKLPAPQKISRKNKKDFNIVGKSLRDIDLEAKISGQSIFGMDVKVDKMVYASIERAPTRITTLNTVDDKSAKAVPGVLDVIKIEPIGEPDQTNWGIVVIANNSWSAFEGRRKLKIQWNSTKESSSKDLAESLRETLNKAGKEFRKQGDFESLLKENFKKHEAIYETAYLAHAPMEPLCATANFKGDSCEIWAPTQDPQGTKEAVVKYFKLNPDKVTIHVTLLGGAFGRKAHPDFVLEAVSCSKKMKAPVKVVWTREDEIKFGYYHAQSLQKISALLKGDKILGWKHHTVFPSITKVFNAKSQELAPWEVGMGASNVPYNIRNIVVQGSAIETPIRIAWYRSVCNIFHSFSVNSFIDELAHSLKKDEYKLRLDLLKPYEKAKWDVQNKTYKLDTGRLAAVLKLAADKIQWSKKRPKNTAVGIACHYSFFSHVAVALEVTKTKGSIKVNRAVVAIDCGKYVNPETIKAQMEGSVVFGISHSLYGKITLENGSVVQNSFDDYPVLRIEEAPEKIDTIIVDNDEPSSGVGEPGVPPIAPALASAIFKLTGKRNYSLPFST